MTLFTTPRGMLLRAHARGGYPANYRRSSSQKPSVPVPQPQHPMRDDHGVWLINCTYRAYCPNPSGWSTHTDPWAAPCDDGYAPMYEDYEQRHTLSALYLPKQQQQQFTRIDHLAKRKQRDLDDIRQAATRLGMDASSMEGNLRQLQQLLPTLTPNLYQMNAANWVRAAYTCITTPTPRRRACCKTFHAPPHASSPSSPSTPPSTPRQW